jgi:PucR C-terminal helix-turn-helix domain/GGDEF-like domain
MTSAASLADRLTNRLPDLERMIFTRVEAVADPRDGDADYLVGLRASVRVGLEYALRALKGGEEGAGAIPDLLLDQAREAARNGISLDTVLRRYLAGHTILLDLVIREAATERLPRGALQELLRTQATLLDRLLAAVADEHSRVLALGLDSSTGARRLRTIERLVTGEDPGPAPELRYELGGKHVALIVAGPGAPELLQDLSTNLDRSLLLATPDNGEVFWAWLGGRTSLGTAQLAERAAATPVPDMRLAIGESGGGIDGWRLSHRQARAAWPIARRGADHVVRYVDVALLTSALQDQLLVESLQKLYLEPLEDDRDGGETLRRTLRAYFAANQSAASAAAMLGVSRQAVSGRLRMIEERIGRPLASCVTELDTALRMRQFNHATSHC